MKKLLIPLLGMLMTGCVSTDSIVEEQAQMNDPYYAPILPEEPAEDVVQTGSLFRGQFSDNIYADTKAKRVGDIISVELQENTQASKNAKTEYGRDQNYDLNPIAGLGGNNVNLGGDSIQLGVSSSNAFTGDSKSDQSNSLSGTISVSVLKVFANGNLLVRGEKWIALNTGKEYLRLTGIIRQQDISANNSIASTKIANARIEYSGTGSFQNGQQPGWISRFFASTVWPF
jgi:flagellar L-ring protein precursor FlgH